MVIFCHKMNQNMTTGLMKECDSLDSLRQGDAVGVWMQEYRCGGVGKIVDRHSPGGIEWSQRRDVLGPQLHLPPLYKMTINYYYLLIKLWTELHRLHIYNSNYIVHSIIWNRHTFIYEAIVAPMCIRAHLHLLHALKVSQNYELTSINN